MAPRRSSRGVGGRSSPSAPRPVEESTLKDAVANLAALDLAGLRLRAN
jgi:hypothetical protein